MKSIVYERCQKILQLCKEKGFLKSIPMETLKQLIAENIAGDPRQVKLYLSRLEWFGFMKQLNAHIMQIVIPGQEEGEKEQEQLDKVILKQYGILSE